MQTNRTKMMRAVKQLPYLTLPELCQLHNRMYNDDYKIVIGNNIVFPVGILPELLKKRTSHCTASDKEARFKVIFLSTDDFSIPISIFVQTVTGSFQTMLILAGGVQGIFTTSRVEFYENVEAMKSFTKDEAYNDFIKVRKELIKKIFEVYYSYNPEMEAFMSWAVRGKDSLTRKIAEEIGFYRVQVGNSELYFKKKESLKKHDLKKIVTDLSSCHAKARKRMHIPYLINYWINGKKIRREEEKIETLIPNYCATFLMAHENILEKKYSYL